MSPCSCKSGLFLRAQDNDDASDWLAELEEAPDLDRIGEAFDQVLSTGDSAYLEVTECAEAVAAATVQDPDRSELHELMMEDAELGAAWSDRMRVLESALTGISQRLAS